MTTPSEQERNWMRDHGRSPTVDEFNALKEMRGPVEPVVRHDTEAGDWVRLDHTSDEWSDLVPGQTGVVTLVDSLGTVHVDWDCGSSLGLVPGQDRWTVTRHREEDV